MERFRDILLAVWREACQHIDLQECVDGVARLLVAEWPVARLTVEWVDPEHDLIATLAAAPRDAGGAALAGRHCSTAAMKKLQAWIKRGDIGELAADQRAGDVLAPLALSAGDGDVRAAPLRSRGGATGVLTVSASPGERFARKHLQMLAALQEPLAVALENDRRLHELAALREAAEADRRSLLRRMGRQDIQDRIVGEQAGLAPVMKRIDLVSASDAPVLILGETGAGKEVVARAIHNRSDREFGPFIRVNCGAIPSELIDAQLFGHEKGAFTGATETRHGWFERADGGTLFLDEIGELPLPAQVRFLRVLQDAFIERVGGRDPIRVDVRVIAATHRDLASMVRDGRFREDLWYRIAVFPILLPPLRERADDIPALASHFAEKAALKFGLPAVAPSEADIQALRAYRWPGNIRELGAVIDRAAILGEGRRLEIAAALGFSTADNGALAGERAGASAPRTTETPDTLDDAIRRHIVAALERCRGRIEGRRGVAAALAVNPHTLRARMRRLGIDWAAYRQE